MFASDSPAVEAAAPAQPDIIEIVGTRAGQTLKIDRRTYQVQQTSNSAQKDTLQLLRGLPAVTISPDDTINLLGTPNVTVQIDGREARTEQLRILHGADIDKIEIITNPSAQYSASGTGGIINIVLRKKRSEGTSGSASLDGSTLGNVQQSSSVKVKRGKWTYELETWGRAGRISHSTFHKLRSVEQFEGGPATVNTEDGGGHYRDVRGMLHPKVTYELDSRTSLIGEAYTGFANVRSVSDHNFVGLTPDFDSFSERQSYTGSGNPYVQLMAALDHKGKKDGETLKASSYLYFDPPEHRLTENEFGDGSNFQTDQRTRMLIANTKVDWEHPLGHNRILSTGASWDRFRLRMSHDFINNGTPVDLGNTINEFSSSRTILAGYVTFQQPIGTFTFMPGLRVERGSWSVSSPGQVGVSRSETDVFPTLHIDHPLSKELQMTLSYSKRIDRPDPWSLQPYPVLQDALSIQRGNPNLKPQSTDSFEFNLHYHRKSLDAGLIVYDREISRLWNTAYSVDANGINESMLINAGHERDRGAEFDVSTPVLKRVKFSTSINLFDTRVPIDLGPIGTGRLSTFRYTSNSTLEWDGAARGTTPGDIAQLQVQTESPMRTFQMRYKSRASITWSYTHSFNPKLSVTATAENLLTPSHNRHRLDAPLVQEDYDSRADPQFKIKLLKTFGKK